MIDYAVIIAVGSQHHESSLVQERPHAMLPALGKPMIVRMMNQIYQAGIRKFLVVVGLSEGSVASYLSQQWMPDVKIELIFKAEDKPLYRLLAELPERIGRPFLISHYNSFCHTNFMTRLMKHHEKSPDDLILAGAKHSLNHHLHHIYALVESDFVSSVGDAGLAGRDDAYLVNGLAVCGGHFLDYLGQARDIQKPHQSKPFMNIVADYLGTHQNCARLADASWLLQVASDMDLLVLNHKLLQETHDNHILSEIPYTAKIIPPVRIDPRVSIGQDASIGPNVYLEQGSTVGHGAQVRDAIVLDRGVIMPKTIVANDIIGRRGSILKT